MPKSRKPARVQSRATAKVKNPRGIPLQNLIVDPTDVAVDDLETATGSIVPLGQMLVEHSSAEVWIIPRDLLSLSPR
jgi:hypothetical protein